MRFRRVVVYVGAVLLPSWSQALLPSGSMRLSSRGVTAKRDVSIIEGSQWARLRAHGIRTPISAPSDAITSTQRPGTAVSPMAGSSSGDLPPLPSLDDRAELRSTHAYSDEANWLVPGRVLCGRYPGSDPFLPVSRDEQLARMRDLVHRGGVSVFVCLQDEIPAQNNVDDWGPTREVAMKGRHGFHWYAGDARQAAAEAAGDVRFVYFPASESGQSIQPMAKLHLLIQGLKHQIVDKGQVVYVHCWGGCGRTGIVASCLLGALYPHALGDRPDEAMGHVNMYFHLRSELALMPHKRSPETEEQIEQVREYFRMYLSS